MNGIAGSRPALTPMDAAALKSQMLQQRLLLLNHAAKCSVPEDEMCQVSRHCGQFKNLWKHILGCKNNKCEVTHCISSRYVLSHYANCTDPGCSICPRVRESAKRECCERTDSSDSASKKSRSSYWWASETFVQFTKAVTVTTKDFISSPSIDKINFNMTKMSISHPEKATTLTQRTGYGSSSSLDLLVNPPLGARPPTRPRAHSGASSTTSSSINTNTNTNTNSQHSSSFKENQLSLSLSPSLASSNSSVSNSSLFSHLQPAPFVSVAHVPGGNHGGTGSGTSAGAAASTGMGIHSAYSVNSVSAAQDEYTSNLSSFSSVCSYRDSTNGSPYMSPQRSPVTVRKEGNKFNFDTATPTRLEA